MCDTSVFQSGSARYLCFSIGAGAQTRAPQARHAGQPGAAVSEAKQINHLEQATALQKGSLLKRGAIFRKTCITCHGAMERCDTRAPDFTSQMDIKKSDAILQGACHQWVIKAGSPMAMPPKGGNQP